MTQPAYTGSKAQTGNGTIFSIGPRSDAGGTPTYLVVGEVSEVPTSGNKWDTEDVSNLQSAYDKEFRKTMRDNGTKTITYNRVSTDAGQVALTAAYNDPTGAYLFQIAYPKEIGQTTTGDVDTFTAIVESVNTNIGVGKIIKGTATLKQSGGTTTVEGA